MKKPEKEKRAGLTPLPPEVEKQLPEMVQQIRAFYFSLSEEERRKLDERVAHPNAEPRPATTASRPTKFCYECGKQINRPAMFCEFCGVQQPNLT